MKNIQKTKKQLIVSLILKFSVIVFAVIGINATSFGDGGFMSKVAFLYFTIQSNIWIALICAIFLVIDILRLKGKFKNVPNFLYILKYMATTAITLTFLVFVCMLTPQMIIQGNASYLFSLSNICVHNIVPILAIVDFLLFDFNFETKKSYFLFSTILPYYYVIFAYICSFKGITFGGDAKYPYFFMDYEANSWFGLGDGHFGVFYWIIILTAVVVGYSALYIFLKNKRAKKLSKNEAEPKETE